MTQAKPSQAKGICMLLLALCAWSCVDRAETPPEAEPSAKPPSIQVQRADASADPYVITHVAHGSIFNEQGPIKEVTLQHLTHTQADHLRQLEDWAKKRGVRLPASDPREDGDILARGVRIDQLIQQLQPPNQAWLHQVNVTVRVQYLRHLLKDNPNALDKLDPSAGDDDVKLRPQSLVTALSGIDYINRCKSEGVPVFDTIRLQKSTPAYNPYDPNNPNYDPNNPNVPIKPPANTWINWGIFTGQFIIQNREPQLWSYESDSPSQPPGICLALPRWQGDIIRAFGIICLGYDTGKVCYFDNRNIANDTSVGSESFLSGAGLHPPLPGQTAVDPGGVCSDCHAGGNPFIVHPDKDPFKFLIQSNTQLSSALWPDHIVHSTWPNVGPLAALPVPLAGESACASCHNAGSQSQFPQISQALPGYCGAVLFGSTAPATKTMPPYGLTGSYQTQAKYLGNLCTDPPNPDNTTNSVPTDDAKVLSPPIVFSPIYGCSSVVGVTGVRLHAQVNVFVNGTLAATQTVIAPSQTMFNLNAPLQAGDQVSAEQSFGGQTSAMSKIVPVTEFQGELNPPSFDPRITHECAESVGVRHVEGTFLQLYVNGVEVNAVQGSPTGHGSMDSPVTFKEGDTLTITQSLCKQTSKPSDPIQVLQAPNPLRALTINPLIFYTGQEMVDISSIVEGAFVRISEQLLGTVASFASWPFNGFSAPLGQYMGRPIQTGDRFTFVQRLCDVTSPPLTSPLYSVQACGEMPAPKIEQPRNGDDFIVVRSAVPGATIRVQVGNDEIGDGAGNPIALTRPVLSGEVLIVSQQLGTCNAAQAFVITVL